MVSPVAAKAIEKVAQKYIEKKGAGGGKRPSRLGGGPFDKAKEIKGLGGSSEGASAVPSGLKFLGGKGDSNLAFNRNVIGKIGSSIPGPAGKGFELGSGFSNMEGNRLGGGNSNRLGDGPKFQQALLKAVKSELAHRMPGGSFGTGLDIGERLGAAKPKENKDQQKDTPKPGQQGDASNATDQQKDTPKPEDRQKDVPKPEPEQQGDASKPEDQQKDVPTISEQQEDASKSEDQPQEKDAPTTPEEVQTAAQETVEDLTEGSAQGDLDVTATDAVDAEYADHNPEEGIVTNAQTTEHVRVEEMQEQQQTVAKLETDAALGLPPDPSQAVEAENLVAIAREGSAIDAELIDQSQNPALDASNSSQISADAPQEVQTAAQETVEELTAGSAQGDMDVTNLDAVDATYADDHPEEGIVTNAQTAEDRRIEEIQEQQQIVTELETDAALGLAPDPSLVVEDTNIQVIKDEGAAVDRQLIDQSINPDVDTATLAQTGEASSTQLGEVMPESATVADQGVTSGNNVVSDQNALPETQSSNQETTEENGTTSSQETQPETIQEVSTASSQEAILENQIVANQDTKLSGEQPAPDSDANLQRSKEEGTIAQGDNVTSETASKGQKDSGLYIEFTDVTFLDRSSQTASGLAPQGKQEAGAIDAATGKPQGEPGDASVVTDNQQTRPEATTEVNEAMKGEIERYEQFQRQIEELQANVRRQIAELQEQFQKAKGEGGEQASSKGSNPATDAMKKAMEKGRGTARKVAGSLFADKGEEVE